MAELIRRECRHVDYLGRSGEDDVHLIKEALIYDDGTIKPNLKPVYNFERPFYVTKKQYQNYKQKKEYEHISRLNKYMSRQCDLANKIPMALGMIGKRLPQALQSPFIYGGTITTQAILKKAHEEKYGEPETNHTLASLDFECNMLDGGDKIIQSSISHEDESIAYVLRDFLPTGMTDEQIYSELDRLTKIYNPEGIERGVKYIYKIIDEESDIIYETFNKLHEWKPDILSIWNAPYDIQLLEGRAAALDINLANLWSDPDVPVQLRKYHFKLGQEFNITEDGKFKKIPFEDRWHTLYTTASFRVLDSMCTYRRLRSQQPRLGSYSLDAILLQEKLPEKVKIPGCEGLAGEALHIFQQKNKKLDYVVYGNGDAERLITLDNQTLDLQGTLPLFQGVVDFSLAASSGKKADHTLYFSELKYNNIIGSASFIDENDTEAKAIDASLNKQLSTNGIILTVNAWSTALNGSKCLIECPERITNIRLLAFDDDVESSYPSSYAATNACKTTNRTEVIDICGNSVVNFKRVSLNIMNGRVNALEAGIELYNNPTPEELLQYFDAIS